MVAQRVTYISKSTLITSMGMGVAQHYEAMLSGVSVAGQSISVSLSEPQLSHIENIMAQATCDVLPHDIEGRTAMIISTTKGDIDNIHRRNPLDFSAYKQYISQQYPEVKPLDVIIISNACISGVAAVIVADRYIKAGYYDNIVVVGADLMTEFTTSGFKAFKSVSAELCRPYDVRRDGLSLGEACGAILLTCNDSLTEGYIVCGGSMTNDANHISGPSRTGQPLGQAIEEALSEASLSADDIAFINAHGTATIYNDEMESKAIAHAGLSKIPINSLKPYFGHTLGASGVIEIALSVEQHRRGTLLATLGFEQLGTPFPLNVSSQSRTICGKAFVKTASGFGGCNAAVVIARDDSIAISSSYDASDIDTKRIASVTIKDGIIQSDVAELYRCNDDFATFIRAAYKQLGDTNAKFYKMSDICKLGYIGMEFLVRCIGTNMAQTDKIGIVMRNINSSTETDKQHRTMLDDCTSVSPAIFVYTLPNIIIGEISIRHRITGEGLFFISDSDEEVDRYAKALMHRHRYDAVVVGSCDKLGEHYYLKMEYVVRQ